MPDPSETPTTTSNTPTEEQIITSKCQQVIDDFRKGEFSRGEAVKRITLLIEGATPSLSQDAAQRALDSYVDMVLEASMQFGPRGRASSRTRESDRRSRERSRPERRQESGRERSSSRDPGQKDKSPRPSKRHRHGRHHRSRSSSHSGSETDGSDEPRKKPRANRTKYGWAASSKSYKSTLRPEVQQNADYLREYRIDVAAAKADLFDSTIAPEFPESEWSNLLLGKQVDFDVLLTSHYSSKLDDKHVQRVGDVELSYGGREASRKVTSYGDWVTSFDMFQDAVVFAFPHRKAELTTYRTHVVGQFKNHDDSFAARVIEYDQAVRKKVSQNRSLLLSDLFEFFGLYIQYITPTGANVVATTVEAASSSGGRGKGKQPSNRKAEPCRRYNADACPNAANLCRYRHICSGCNAKGHMVPDCPKSVKHEA